LHDLRHGAATLALVVETDLKVVSVILGHATIQRTNGTYNSVLPDTAYTAAEKTAALAFGTRRCPDRHSRRPAHHRSG
jgi:integrase